ncbi:unnamed protein product [Schistosoma mattheei]|uniref:Uncharacterized protein n=1 Tax=Schistosoma mattheei TaxID=31246 RepID=A0A183P5G4_9TREM|nr:unnamed protein product [Schistosoma mattheei]
MERPENVGDWEDQSNSNENEEIQPSSTGNQRNQLHQDQTPKARCERDAAILQSQRRKCSTHSGGTIFPHKRMHKPTSISSDHTTENQTDHACINKKFRRTMEDVRPRRGSEIASDETENKETLDNWGNRITNLQ